jgi:hypothetical protein
LKGAVGEAHSRLRVQAWEYQTEAAGDWRRWVEVVVVGEGCDGLVGCSLVEAEGGASHSAGGWAEAMAEAGRKSEASRAPGPAFCHRSREYRQRCRAESGRTTHWSTRDEGDRGDGEEDGETHIGIGSLVVLLESGCRCLIWSSTLSSSSLVLYDRRTNSWVYPSPAE